MTVIWLTNLFTYLGGTHRCWYFLDSYIVVIVIWLFYPFCMSSLMYVWTVPLIKGLEKMKATLILKFTLGFSKRTLCLVAYITENSFSTCVMCNSSHRLHWNISRVCYHSRVTYSSAGTILNTCFRGCLETTLVTH